MSPLQSPGRFSQRPCVPLPCPSLPATLPRPPAHPADLLVFCPAWPTFPQLSLGGSQPGPASSATRRPRLGKCGPTPTGSCQWSQRSGWVVWGGAEDLDTASQGSTKTFSRPVFSPSTAVTPFLQVKTLNEAGPPAGIQPCRQPSSLLGPPPVSMFLEHLLCPLPHFRLSPDCALYSLPLSSPLLFSYFIEG